MAAEPDITLKRNYQVRSADVFLSLRIGEGQFGTSDIFLDSKRLLRASGPIGSLLLGDGSSIVGKDILVRSVINDVSSATNRMSVTYRLRGGAKAQEFVAKGKVASEGNLLIFEATFSLV